MALEPHDLDTAHRQQRNYRVIARRYRPQTFEDLVGQEHVARALINAIQTNRVGHAYLFTGARGVGKTSTARILAKALNAPDGPTPHPDPESDIFRSIDAGEDVDVLEIDGASNRGIEEIRQLRANVSVRPSRARYKIYIIDEVHMLTTPAFNALLKTLEEPPEHVKFIFCTTDPEKIPVTVLSRCQRFDFAPVDARTIADRLAYVARQEGLDAAPEALQLLARRAAGSMRDSQSLLEQLLAFCHERITVDDVHQLLGTARATRVAALAAHLMARDAAAALRELDAAIVEGADAGQLAEQLLDCFRDMLAAAVGCPPEMMLVTSPADHAELVRVGNALGVETLLAIGQILDQLLVRLRSSTRVRTQLEVALVRIARLENLDELGPLVRSLGADSMPAAASPARSATRVARPAPADSAPPAIPTGSQAPEKKKGRGTAEVGAAEVAWDDAAATRYWSQALTELDDPTSQRAEFADRVAIGAPDLLVVTFRREYTLHKEACERPERRSRLEEALSRVAGRPLRVRFEMDELAEPAAAPASVRSRRQALKDCEKHPLIRRAIEVFGAEVIRVELPRSR